MPLCCELSPQCFEQLIEWPAASSTPSCHSHSSLFAAHYACNMLEKPVQTVSSSGSPLCWTLYEKALRRSADFSLLTSAQTLLWAAERHNLNSSRCLFSLYACLSLSLSVFGHLDSAQFLWHPDQICCPLNFLRTMSKCCTQTPVSKSTFMANGGLESLYRSKLDLRRREWNCQVWTEHAPLNIIYCGGGGLHADGTGVTPGKHCGQILCDVSKCFRKERGAKKIWSCENCGDNGFEGKMK